MVTVAELSSGRLAYDVSDGRGNTRRYLEGEVLHLRDRTDDGKIGRSRLSRAAETVAGVSAANTHAATFLAHGAAPSGVIEQPGIMKPEQPADLRDSFQSLIGGAGTACSTLVLGAGMTWAGAQKVGRAWWRE